MNVTDLIFPPPTPTDLQIVRLLSDGNRAQDIAEKRGRALKTVEVQIHNLKRKTGCKSAAHLVATFLRNKLID